ncbi:MAG: OmpA family protein [Saprospiraceae bacterium]
MKKQYILYALMLLAVNAWAQKETKLEADKAYDQLSYLKAADLYQQLGESGLDEMAKIRLADSYRLNGDTESAEYWYAQAVQEDTAPEDMLHYAQVLQSNNKCEMALDWYNQYRVLVGEIDLIPRAGIKDCANLIFLPKQQVTVTNLRQLNSAHLDYSPVPYKGGVVFTSTRGKGEDAIEDTWTKDNFSDLFFAKSIGEQGFTQAKLLTGNINGDFHDGTATFNKLGTVMYFSRNNDNGKNSNDIIDLKIYSATLNNKKWGNVVELPFNDDEYATCHPTLSVDGNTLYFASNRIGGFGGMDLYKSTRTGSYWSAPENLGKAVNTAGNEIFPFIDQAGMLYFASNGLPGVGGLDIYQAHLSNGDWTQPENLGEPINSSKDDFGYSKLDSGEAGYFTSNRSGGLGSDDIYLWSGNLMPTPNQQNIITVIDEFSNDRISDAMVTIVEGVYKNKSNIPVGVGKQVKNGKVQPNQPWAQPISFLTDVKGKVQPEVKHGKTYTILIEKQGYAPVKKVVNSYDLLRKPEWIVPLRKRQGLALNGSVIHQAYNRMIPNAVVTLFNFCTGEYEETTTDDEGNFAFFLECNCDYEVVAKKERFAEDKKKYSTLGINCNEEKPITSILYLDVPTAKTTSKPVVKSAPTPPVNIKPSEILKVGQVITLEDVYYDFNKASIRGDASASLDHLIGLLQQYPSMEIELYSHTDSRGNDGYNEQLSQRRAESAVQYITARGIARNRLLGKGYGESRLKNTCADGINCEEWQHQENRRTEVKITQLDANVKVEYRK